MPAPSSSIPSVPSNPANAATLQPEPPDRAARATSYAFVPIADFNGPGAALGALLKRPGSVIYELHAPRAARLLRALALVALICLALDGLAIGSFSGGMQWWAAPGKTVVGTLLSALICLPSLYIFTCLGGADVRLGPLCGILLATICLHALLLVGFAPVAWVFAQSTDSVAFMGTLDLVFWAVSMLFAVRLLSAYMAYIGTSERSYLRLWFLVFLLVCLQMTTALRPFVGRSSQLLPAKKLFFLAHWADNLNGQPE